VVCQSDVGCRRRRRGRALPRPTYRAVHPHVVWGWCTICLNGGGHRHRRHGRTLPRPTYRAVHPHVAWGWCTICQNGAGRRRRRHGRALPRPTYRAVHPHVVWGWCTIFQNGAGCRLRRSGRAQPTHTAQCHAAWFEIAPASSGTFSPDHYKPSPRICVFIDNMNVFLLPDARPTQGTMRRATGLPASSLRCPRERRPTRECRDKNRKAPPPGPRSLSPITE
jgi:hypothetical protein